MQPVKFLLQQQTLWLSPERCLYWEEAGALILSDIHFGKSGHFRKEGIGIPQAVFKEDLQRLFAQVQFFKPNQIIIVGDFFHSSKNNELLLFEKCRKDIAAVPIHLVKGNHDILHNNWYKENKMEVHDLQLLIAPFTFVHDLIQKSEINTDHYFISGHIHPGVRIEGMAKQSLHFPCFYFTQQYAVLPAFGKFTGLHIIKAKKKENVFAVVNKKIIAIQ